MADDQRNDQLLLENVRLSFPDIWKATSIKGSDPKFAASFLLDKKENSDQIKKIKGLMWALCIEKFGGKEKAKALLDKGKILVCLHEGNTKDYDGYSDENMYISSSSGKRPSIIDRDRTPLAQEDGRPYAGCIVNAAVRLWAMDNDFGRRINCELLGLQFVKDGEPFGAPPFRPEEVFPELDKPKDAGEKTPGKKAPSKAASSEPDDTDEIPF